MKVESFISLTSKASTEGRDQPAPESGLQVISLGEREELATGNRMRHLVHFKPIVGL